MSQTSTASKLSHTNPSNDELLQTISEPDVVSISSNLAGQQECSSIRKHQASISLYAVGCEVHDNYAASAEDRLNFGQFKVPGREGHIESLHKIYDYVCRGFDRRINQWVGESSVAIVGGTSGTGKSTLIKQFQHELREKSKHANGPCMPFFIEGKFDELVGADPFSAIVEAFTGFAEDMIQRDTQELEHIRSCIQKQLGAEAAVLTTVVPMLKVVIDCEDESVMNGSKENAMNKLKYIFQTFVGAISTPQRPVIMFLDDLQWCDSASLDLILALLTDLDMKYFMFIGSYRSDEVDPDHDLLRGLEATTIVQPVTRIEMSNLPRDELNLLLCNALQREGEDDTMELTEVIFEKTSGNIFHSMQILEELQRMKRLTFSRQTSQWEWDLEVDSLDHLLSDDVVKAVMGKISHTDPDLQRVLILAAYTRSGIDVDTLSQLTVINGQLISSDELLPMLDKAVLGGLLANTVGSRIYSFGHDRIQEAGE